MSNAPEHEDALDQRAGFVDRLFESIERERGRLVAPIEVVQKRLIRAVGRVQAPDGEWVYLKVMTFPRLKDRIRYVFRPLPATHEARMLEVLRAGAGADLPGPEPIGVVSRRVLFWPKLSVLALRGLAVDSDSRIGLRDAAEAAATLAAIGLMHRDLHSGNFVRLSDGRTAVLDFQSVSARTGPLGSGDRRRLATKLWQERWPDADPQVLVETGLVESADLESVLAEAEAERRLTLRRRILRCLRTSTEFRRRVGWFRIEHRRRAARGALRRFRPSLASARQLWIGDRVRELCDGAEPLLAGARLGVRPGSRSGSLYIADDGAASNLAATEASLLEAYRRCFDSAGRLRSAAELRSAGIDLDAIL